MTNYYKIKRRWKSIKKFMLIFLLSFIVMEIIEHLIFLYLKVDLKSLKLGWIGFIIIYGFKYHIFCCLIPSIWATYKCRHKNKCNHQHCDL
jgi:hypothetical protein